MWAAIDILTCELLFLMKCWCLAAPHFAITGYNITVGLDSSEFFHISLFAVQEGTKHQISMVWALTMGEGSLLVNDSLERNVFDGKKILCIRRKKSLENMP